MRRQLPAHVVVPLVLMLTLAACRPPTADTAAAPPYAAIATVKDLMQSIVDPAADVVWLSVTEVHTAQGIQETVPRTEEEWNKVRQGALTLAEGIGSIGPVRCPFAPPCGLQNARLHDVRPRASAQIGPPHSSGRSFGWDAPGGGGGLLGRELADAPLPS
jgi:hypothetical protein